MKKIRLILVIVFLIVACITGCGHKGGVGKIFHGKKYEVRYELNGGTLISGNLLQEVEKGEDAEDPEVEREGYILDGWSESSQDIDSNRVIVAQWKRAWKVEFDTRGGEVDSGDLSQIIGEGEQPNPPVVTKEGSDFLGWEPEIKEADGDTIYVARWSAMSPQYIYDEAAPCVVEITNYDENNEANSLGSGFFMDDEGRVITCYHVIEGAYSLSVTLQDGSVYEVDRILAYDDEIDAAILETGIKDTRYLKKADEKADEGENVYAIGSSRGMTGSLSDGIVATSSREIDGVQYIQMTAPISGGNSGGPLLNSNGEVLGINVMSMQESQNLNFALDISELDKLDYESPVTIRKFYELTNIGFIYGESVKQFLSNASKTEEESNDSMLRSDKLTSGEWVAGVLSDVEDRDFYYIDITSSGRVRFELAPCIKSDTDSIMCGVLRMKDDEYEVVSIMEESSNYTYNNEKVCVVDIDEPGYYFLFVAYDDDYEFDHMPYYLVCAYR